MRSAVLPNFIPVEQVDCDRIAAFRSVIHENQAARMKSKDLESEPLQVGQYVRIQKREKPFTWSEVGLNIFCNGPWEVLLCHAH